MLGLHYEIPWPNRELETARPFRRSPVYHLLARGRSACFGSRDGLGAGQLLRAARRSRPVIEYSWGKPNWLPWSAAEQRAARTAVAVFDQTSFSKFLVTGPDARGGLQWLCTADVGVPPGQTVYTGMLNDRGTYEADVTLTRLSRRGVPASSAAPRRRTGARTPDSHPRQPPSRRRPATSTLQSDVTVVRIGRASA